MKRFLAVLLLICAAVRIAHGFALEGQSWPQGANIVMQLSLGGNQTLIDNSGSFGVSAEDALSLWNEHLNNVSFSVVRNSDVSPSSGDNLNSVFFSDSVFGSDFGSDTLAVTLRLFQGSTLVEADVVFNNSKSFNSYRGSLRQAQGGGTLHDFHRVALHEFGHVLGLDHPDEANQNKVAVMNSRESDVDALQQDDVDGAQYLYGSAPPHSTPTPAPVAADNLVNLSTRLFVGTGDSVLIGGFIIQGTQASTVVLRAIGPSLTARGVGGALSDPVLRLRNGAGDLVAENDDWAEGPNAASIQDEKLAPDDSRESAIQVTLDPGAYTVTVSGFNNATGVGLVELYDLQATNGRAGNISTRGFVSTGDNVMIGGFIVGGDKTKQVAVRAIGPSLASAGVSGSLADPLLELRDSAGTLVASNDDWADDPNAAALNGYGLSPTNDRESALLATLNPGNYTAVVRGYNNSTGVGLVEVYDLSPAPNQ
jgi:hypothetical protein